MKKSHIVALATAGVAGGLVLDTLRIGWQSRMQEYPARGPENQKIEFCASNDRIGILTLGKNFNMRAGFQGDSSKPFTVEISPAGSINVTQDGKRLTKVYERLYAIMMKEEDARNPAIYGPLIETTTNNLRREVSGYCALGNTPESHAAPKGPQNAI